MEKNKLILFLISLLFVSNGILFFLLYRKSPPAAPVIVAFEGKNAAYSKKFSAGHDSFWNNYPYVVITNEGKLVDTTAYFDRRTFSRLDKLKNKQILRYIQNKDYSATNDSVLSSLRGFADVVIVTDSVSARYLHKRMNILKLNNDVYVLVKRKINNRTDVLGLSYLFSISRDGRMTNLYYPRSQTPELTTKYLSYVAKSVVFN